MDKMSPKEYKAFAWAVAAHKDQYYNDLPYITHVARVVKNLIEMDYTEDEYVCTAWLHDVIEDTEFTTLEEIEKYFGKEIRDAVDAISRRKRIVPIDDRNENVIKESELEYLIRVAANPIASVVKHADMCDNLLMTRSIAAPTYKQGLWKKYVNAIQYLSERK